MTSFEDAWGPTIRPPQLQQRAHAAPAPLAPPAQHVPHVPTQTEKDQKTAAERVPDATAAAAASQVAALKEMHRAIVDLRQQLDERNRVVEAAGAAAAAVPHEHRRSLNATIDALTVTVALGFLLLILCVALTGAAMCRRR